MAGNRIDHTGHPHSSTPAMRALCRANGGTGSIAKPKEKTPAKKTTAKPNAARDALLNDLFGNKAAKAPVKKDTKKTPQLTESKIPVANVVKAKTSTASVKRGVTKERHDELMAKTSDEDNQMDALRAIPVGIDGPDYRGLDDPQQRRAVKRYVGEGYGHINSALRGQSTPNDNIKDQIKQLDAVMAKSKLTEDVGAFRGVDGGRVLFGDALDGDMTGFEWREKGFSSTTVNEDVADDFTLGDDEDEDGDEDDEDGGGGGGEIEGVKMRVVLPKGTGAIQGSGLNEEAELIIARDSDFRVIRDRGVDSSGVRILDVELISQGGKNVG